MKSQKIKDEYMLKINEFEMNTGMPKDDKEKNKQETMKLLVELDNMRLDHENKLNEIEKRLSQKEQMNRLMLVAAGIFVAAILAWIGVFKI